MTPCGPGSPSTNQTTTTSAGSAPSDGSDTHPIIWVVFQGKRFGPYWDTAAARKEGFVIDETPLDEIQYGGWPVKWPEIPKVNC